MGLAEFGLMLAHIGVWVSDFLFGINQIDGAYPVFGSFFLMLLFLWILEGIGYIIRLIFGWDMEEIASDKGGYVRPRQARTDSTRRIHRRK